MNFVLSKPRKLLKISIVSLRETKNFDEALLNSTFLKKDWKYKN